MIELDPRIVEMISNLEEDLNERDAQALDKTVMNFLMDFRKNKKLLDSATENYMVASYAIGFAAGLGWRDVGQI